MDYQNNLGSPKLCSVCEDFDVHALLVAANSQKPAGFNDPSSPSTYESLRPALYQFFKQHDSLASLQSQVDYCDLCQAIFDGYQRMNPPAAINETTTNQGLGRGPIWIGTTAWDATLHCWPHIVATQFGENDSMRILASFEACALRGKFLLASCMEYIIREIN